MAGQTLTENLGGVNADFRPIASSPPQENPVGQALGAIGSGITAFVDKANTDRQLLKFGQEQQDRRADNEFQTGANSILGQPTQVPTAVQQQVAGVVATQTGVNQGKLPPAQLEMQMEQLLAKTQRDYPGSTAEVYKYAKEQGLDHWLFHAADAELSAQTANEKAQVEWQNNMKTASWNAGLTSPNDPDELSVAKGAQYTADTDRLSQLTKVADYNKTLAETGKVTADTVAANNKNTSDGLFQTVNAMTMPAVAADIDRITQLAQGAGNDPAKLNELLTGLMPTITSELNNHRANALAVLAKNGADASAIDAVNKQYDNWGKVTNDIFTGDGSQVAGNLKAVANIATEWKLQSSQAAPLFSHMVETFGAQTTLAIANGQVPSPFTAEEIAGAKSEALQMFQPGNDPNSYNARMLLFDQILKGQVKYQTMNDTQRIQAITGVIPVVMSPQAAAVAGSDGGKFGNAYGVAVSAVDSIQPGNQDTNQVRQATQAIASQTAQASLTAMLKAGDPTAKQLVLASGAESSRLVTVLQHQNLTDTSGAVSLQFDPVSGAYKPVLDQKAAAAYIAKQGAYPTPGVGAFSRPAGVAAGALFAPQQPTLTPQQLMQQGSKELQMKQSLLNQNLAHISWAAQYDDTGRMPKNLSPAQTRTYVVTGQLPPGVKPPTGVTQTQADKDWWASEGAVKADLQGKTATNSKTIGPESPSARELHYGSIADRASLVAGVPPAAGRLLIKGESSFDPNADVRVTHPPGWEKSHAYGLTGLQPATAFSMGLKVPGLSFDDKGHAHYQGGPNGSPLPGDERMDPEKNAEAGLKYFAQLIRNNGGDVRKAAMTFSGGQYGDKHVDAIVAAYHADHQRLMAGNNDNSPAS